MKNRFILLSATMLLLFGCKAKKEVEASVVYVSKDTVSVVEVKTTITDSAIASLIQPLVTTIDSSKYYIQDQFVFSNTVLPQAYDSVNYYPLWNNNKNRTDAIRAFANAREHGLIPTDYHIENILNYNSRFNDLNTEERASYDVLLTDAVMLYSYHLIRGKLIPESHSASWNFISNDLPMGTSEILLKSLKEQTITQTLSSFEPQDNEYKMIQKALVEQYSVVLDGEWPVISFSSTIHSNESDANMPVLRERLVLEGYLSKADTSSSLIYEFNLETAIKHFQQNHGLNADGVVGAGTLRMLNISAQRKLEMLIVNLERKRWAQDPDNQAYIKVNIAAFRMEFISNEIEEGFSSKVMVGQTQKQTPIFKDDLQYIVFNPTWTLPQSISSTETLAKLKRDSNYLEKHNMVIINYKGEVQYNDSVDWQLYDEDYFPFMIRQEPGPNNALGRVKFLFPNKHAIYLHDTPSKYLFSKEQRAFSHGCIRLQNPLDFALFLLVKEDTAWTMDSIKVILDTTITTSIRLKKAIPIYITYQTVTINRNNEIQYYFDVYGRDNELYQYLINNESIKDLVDSRIKN